MPSRRNLIVSAALVLGAWLAAVVGLTLWRYPQFWVRPDERFGRAQRLFETGRPAEAWRELDLAITKDPAAVGYRVFKGYRQLDLKDLSGAEESFRAALRSDPANVEAQLGLADVLAHQRRRDEALAALDRLSSDTLTAGQTRRRSQLYGLLNAPGPALADLSPLFGSGSADPELLEEAIAYALALKDWPRVLTLTEWLQSAAADSETRRWTANARGTALEALGQTAAAYENYQRADNPDQLEQRAGLAWRLRRYDEAAALYDQLSQRQPDEPRFTQARAFVLLAAGRRQEAEAAFRQLVDSGAAGVAVRQSYAWMLNVQRRYAEAWRVIEPLPMPAQDPSLLELQARTAIWAGRSADAVQLVRVLLRLRPQDPELWKELAAAWQATGDTRQAADALAAYLRLQSQDAAARQRLAEILSSTGPLAAAIEQYSRLLADDPGNARVATALGLLQETSGDLENAKASYVKALGAGGTPAPELYLRLARLHRWTAQPLEAVEWFERYLAASQDDGLKNRARTEMALSLLDAGQPPRSLAMLQEMAQGGALDSEGLMTAARAATAMSRADLAARYLESLAAVRPLSTDEEIWLAGTYRAAGERDAALRTYERALGAQSQPSPQILEAIADLRYDIGDYGGALRALQRIGHATDVRLKLARVAARAGDLALAAEAYEAYAATDPYDVDGRLEAARFFAGAGRPQPAIAHYRQVVDSRGAGDLRLELARIHLAAEQFGAAEEWARQAVAAGESLDDARLTLVQALHIQGRNREADATLRELLAAAPTRADAHAWRGQVAAALDRHLTAFREFRVALTAGAEGGERLALWMSSSARKRGDYTRALDGIERAAALGAEAPLIAAARTELQGAAVSSVAVPLWVHSDSNGLRLVHTGASVTVFLPRLVGSLSIDATTGTLAQRAFSTRYSSALLSLAHVFPTPGLELDAQMGLDHFDRGDDLISWRGVATWHVTDDAHAGVSIARQPLLPLRGPAPLRQFNRVLDISAVTPGFFSDSLHAFADFLTRPTHQARIEMGVERLDDRNRQASVYAHYQVPLATGVRQWAVLRPNVFFETFDVKRGSYFSPKRHFTVGTMIHTIRQYPHWDLELEVNPQLLRTDGATGLAGHGLLNFNVKAGRARVGAGTFVFYDGLADYLQWRIGGRVTIPIGR